MSNAEKLALFDLDGTLIDDNYQITDRSIYSAVAEAQDVGWKVGLNSDTPYEALEVWRERFGMKGPIIAEKGAVVELDGMPACDNGDVAAVLDARENIGCYAAKQGIAVWSGNPVEAIRTGLRVGEPGQTAMLINTLSRCSLRFFVRTVDVDGNLQLDDVRTQQVIQDCRQFFPAFDSLEEDNNPASGLLIVSRRGVTKRAGVLRLMSSIGLSRCIMVGNSMSDFIGNDIAEQVAVSNASLDFKQAASVVVDESLTTGCVSILRQLVEREVPSSRH
jgi:hydroxymethylpyrimidine pyrophosphatase-like HAD family hydrolase